MNGCMAVAVDQAVFLGAGANGQPSGILVGSYGITSTAVSAAASWSAFRAAVTRFMTANAAGGPGACGCSSVPRFSTSWTISSSSNTAVSEWDRLVKNIPLANIAMSSNALAAPTGTPAASKALLT